MKVLRHMRFKYKLLFILFSMLALFVSLTFGSLYFTYSVYDKQLYEKASQYLNTSSRVVDMEIKKLESMSLNIATDSQIQQGLKELSVETPDYMGYTIRNKITERLWTHISASVSYVQSAHVIDLTGRESKYGDTVSFSKDKYARMMEEAVNGEGAIRWLYPDEADPMLIMVREIRSFEPLTLKPIGIIFLRINIERLVEDYIGRGTENGAIVLKSESATVFPIHASGSNLAEELHPLKPGISYEIMKMQGDETVFVSQMQSAYTGWEYYHAVPYDAIFETINWLKRSLILIFCVVVIAVAVVGLRLARGMTRPIESLITQMKDVQNLERMDHGVQPNVNMQMDEVGLLHRAFRLMIARINMLIKENYASQLVIHETEFKALQAQINPHFLYNTLESINWLAKKNEQEQISRMVVSLGFLFRSSISLKKNVISLSEELEIVKNYVIIQKYRFRNRLNLSVDVSESICRALIPKLTLQPILENAIQYALEPMVNPCRIRIYAEEVDEGLSIIVEDNGPGMDKEFLQRMLIGEVRTHGSGIGLLNIKERIKLAFGDRYGIQVESEPGVGTKVKVNIPYSKEELR